MNTLHTKAQHLLGKLPEASPLRARLGALLRTADMTVQVPLGTVAVTFTNARSGDFLEVEGNVKLGNSKYNFFMTLNEDYQSTWFSFRGHGPGGDVLENMCRKAVEEAFGKHSDAILDRVLGE